VSNASSDSITCGWDQPQPPTPPSASMKPFALASSVHLAADWWIWA
jgi:hypothetical protein